MWELRGWIDWDNRLNVEKSLQDKCHSSSFLTETKRSDLYIDLNDPLLGLKFRDIPFKENPENPNSPSTEYIEDKTVLLELKIQLKHDNFVEKWWKCIESPISMKATRDVSLLIESLKEELEKKKTKLNHLVEAAPTFKKSVQKNLFLVTYLEKILEILSSPNFDYNGSLYETHKLRSRMMAPVVELLPTHLIQKKDNPSMIKPKFLIKHKKNLPQPENQEIPRKVSFEQTVVQVYHKSKLVGNFQTIEVEGLKPKLLNTCFSSLNYPYSSVSPKIFNSENSSQTTNLVVGYPGFIQQIRKHVESQTKNTK